MKIMKYMQDNFRRCRKTAIIFTILYFVVYCISCLINEKEVTDIVKFMILGCWLLLKILNIIVWGVCIKNYVCLEKSIGTSNVNIGVRVALTLLIGIIVYCNIAGIAAFIIKHSDYLYELLDCVAIKLILTFGWCLLWIYYVINIKVMDFQRGIKRYIIIVLIILLAGVSIVGIGYANEEAELIRFQKMIEYYDEYGEYKYL